MACSRVRRPKWLSSKHILETKSSLGETNQSFPIFTCMKFSRFTPFCFRNLWKSSQRSWPTLNGSRLCQRLRHTWHHQSLSTGQSMEDQQNGTQQNKYILFQIMLLKKHFINTIMIGQ